MLSPMTRPHSMAALVLLGVAIASWMPARAHAGARAFYLGVVGAFVSALPECGETPLAACRAAHRQGSSFDTVGGVVLFELPAGLALRDVLGAVGGQPAAGPARRPAPPAP